MGAKVYLVVYGRCVLNDDETAHSCLQPMPDRERPQRAQVTSVRPSYLRNWFMEQALEHDAVGAPCVSQMAEWLC